MVAAAVSAISTSTAMCACCCSVRSLAARLQTSSWKSATKSKATSSVRRSVDCPAASAGGGGGGTVGGGVAGCCCCRV